jgi:erythromycin esterase
MISRRGILLGAIATAAVAGSPFAAYQVLKRRPPGKDVIAWLRANAAPLASAEPGNGFKDLETLERIVGKARIVGLGEATHGTHEFVTLKHRMIEYCVGKFGFTMIGLEAAYGEERAINDYVLHGKGSAAEAVGAMNFFIWRYEEMVALVEWVRAWNLAHERKVKFYGFDMLTTDTAAARLHDYLRPLAPELAAELDTALRPDVFENFGSLLAAAQEQVLAQVKRILDRFDGERASWTERTSDLEWRLARLSAVVLGQCAGYNRIKGDEAQTEFRDHSMADNVCALLEAEGANAKALLMAHNYHVKRGRSFVPLVFGGSSLPTMGCDLRARFGAEYAVIGFSFNQGHFVAKRNEDGEPSAHSVGPATGDMLDAALAATGLPLFALPLDNLPAEGVAAKWMASRPYQRDIGAFFSEEAYERMLKLGIATFMLAADPHELYDAIFFVETTTAPRCLGRREVGAA